MSKTVAITFFGEYHSHPQWRVMVNFLKRVGAQLAPSGEIVGFSASDDGGCVSFPCVEADSYDMLTTLFENEQSHSVEFVLDGKLYSGDPSWEGHFVLTLCSNLIRLEDGMVDFNWYYQYWNPRLTEHVLKVTGLEFCYHV